jgi:hypothetical protein
MYRPSLAVLLWLLFATVVAGAQSAPYLGGRWILDRDLTTADLRWNKTTAVEVSQSDEDIRFDYFDHNRHFASDTFTTDWQERPRYVTRIERAYARARWQKDGLVIHTRSFLDLEGYRSYSMDDRWELSPDGKTLIERSSDGKVMVFYKDTTMPPQ